MSIFFLLIRTEIMYLSEIRSQNTAGFPLNLFYREMVPVNWSHFWFRNVRRNTPWFSDRHIPNIPENFLSPEAPRNIIICRKNEISLWTWMICVKHWKKAMISWSSVIRIIRLLLRSCRKIWESWLRSVLEKIFLSWLTKHTWNLHQTSMQ